MARAESRRRDTSLGLTGQRSRDTIVYEESCLSLPDYYLKVKRSNRIRVKWQDPTGAPHEDSFEGFPAIVLQHEVDHLEGIPLLNHSSRLKRSRYLSRLRKRVRR